MKGAVVLAAVLAPLAAAHCEFVLLRFCSDLRISPRTPIDTFPDLINNGESQYPNIDDG